MLIRDLVQIDEQAEFRTDVQISDYDDQEVNLGLLRSFLFTATAPHGQVSSVELLKTILDSYVNPNLDNRIAVIANYGHGKSHLALVLANYFGKSYQSEEMRIVLEKIDSAIESPAASSRYSNFREERKPFLIIRLRGDEPKSLRQQFVKSFEVALKEHPATRDVQLPFWYRKAESLLVNLGGEELNKANLFLEQYDTDVPKLIYDVRQRRDVTYTLCRELFTHLHNVPPDLGGEVSMREMIDWAANKYCGLDKPVGGIFITMDEFSLYIMNYAQGNAAGELQDLLNGVENQKIKAVFIALAQHDPITTAKSISLSDIGLQSLQKELDRIQRKVTLYSLMESVIDIYLTQPRAAWVRFRGNKNTRGPLARASNITLDLFMNRYEDTLRWDVAKFDQIITMGCFPLHPLTTAMLCDLNLQSIASAGNPRTVLGFVFEQINNKKDEPVLVADQINWVFPVELVSYFENYLPQNAINLYDAATRNLDPEAPKEQKDLMEALFLQEASRINVNRNNQIEFLSECVGLTQNSTLQHLKTLAKSNVIRFDPGTGLNSFWPIATDPHKLVEIIDASLPDNPFDLNMLKSLNKEFSQPIEVNVDWGHPVDWQAVQKVFTKENFNSSNLKEIGLKYSFSDGNFVEGKRGAVIWLLTQSEEDIHWFGNNAGRILEEAFSDESPPPVVLMLPSILNIDLIDSFRRYKILENLSSDQRQEVGAVVYESEKRNIQKQLSTAIANLRGDLLNYTSIPLRQNNFIVPIAYRPAIQTAGRLSLQQILSKCYKLAYRFCPTEWFTQYRVGKGVKNNLRKSTTTVANVLLRNKLTTNREAVFTNKVAKDLCEKMLWEKWQIVSADYRIKEPGNLRIRKGWDLLNEHLPSGSKDVSIGHNLTNLLNTPFGYDYNTVILLLCAWMGFHMHDLQISIAGRQATFDQFYEIIANGGRKFIQDIASEKPVCLSRRDQSQVIKEVQELINRGNREEFSQEDTKYAIAILKTSSEDQGLKLELCQSANQVADNLQNALEIAEDYDKLVDTIQSEINSTNSVNVLINNQKSIRNLPQLGNVYRTTSSISELTQDCHKKLAQSVQRECQNLENIKRRDQIELHKTKLKDLKKQLKKENLQDLVQRVDLSFQIISEKIEILEMNERETPVRSKIESINVNAPLKDLYSYRNILDEISGYSEETMRLRNERLEKLDHQINQLEQFAEELIDSVERLDTIQALGEWNINLNNRFALYNQTEFKERLEKSRFRVLGIQDFIRKFNRISNTQPENFDEVNELNQQIDDLNTPDITENQLKLLNKIKGDLDSRVLRKVQESEKWLQEMQTIYDQEENIPQLSSKINNPPSFLSEEDQVKLENLKELVQKRVEEDLVTRIEIEFLKIKDINIRRECLKRLQEIIA